MSGQARMHRSGRLHRVSGKQERTRRTHWSNSESCLPKKRPYRIGAASAHRVSIASSDPPSPTRSFPPHRPRRLLSHGTRPLCRSPVDAVTRHPNRASAASRLKVCSSVSDWDWVTIVLAMRQGSSGLGRAQKACAGRMYLHWRRSTSP